MLTRIATYMTLTKVWCIHSAHRTIWDLQNNNTSILKRRETNGLVVSTVATDTLVLKLQAISIHNTD